jgi:hypothetical protein
MRCSRICVSKPVPFFVEGAHRAVAITKKEVERRTFEICCDLVCLLMRKIVMTTSDAEKYSRRAQAAGDVAEVGSAVKHAVDELVRAIRDLEARISRLESKMGDDQLGAPH